MSFPFAPDDIDLQIIAVIFIKLSFNFIMICLQKKAFGFNIDGISLGGFFL